MIKILVNRYARLFFLSVFFSNAGRIFMGGCFRVLPGLLVWNFRVFLRVLLLKILRISKQIFFHLYLPFSRKMSD